MEIEKNRRIDFIAWMIVFVLALVAIALNAHAQEVGQACTADPSIVTTFSRIESQGVLECIPDSAGNFIWEPEGAGIARYDTTAVCTIAGNIRWNGSSMEYCNGSLWQSFGGNGFPPNKSATASFYVNPQLTSVQCQASTDNTGNVTMTTSYYDSNDGGWHTTAGPSQTHLLSGSVYSGPNDADLKDSLQGYQEGIVPGFGWYCMADPTGISETFWYSSSYYVQAQGNTAVYATWQ
jgi:hypothetical protein